MQTQIRLSLRFAKFGIGILDSYCTAVKMVLRLCATVKTSNGFHFLYLFIQEETKLNVGN